MISVLINNYNYKNYIGEAIDSVLNQTYKDFELIIVDDGSTDGSKEVILEYQKKYPFLITAIFKPNGGQSSAFNAGFALSKGEIIAFLDSDDAWYENKLERIVEWHKEYDFIGHAKKLSDGRVDRVPTVMYEKRPELLRQYGFSHTYFITTSFMSVKRGLLEKLLPMPEKNWRICADHYLKIAALYYGNVKYIDEELGFYRIHEKNLFTGNSLTTAKLFSFEKITEKHDNQAIEDLNELLAQKGQELIPRQTSEQYQDALEIIGEGFRIIPGQRYIVYGTGNKGKKNRRFIEEYGGKVIAYADSSDKKWGTDFDGLIIQSPDRIISERNTYDKIVIGSSFFREISVFLESKGFARNRDYMYVETMSYCVGMDYDSQEE